MNAPVIMQFRPPLAARSAQPGLAGSSGDQAAVDQPPPSAVVEAGDRRGTQLHLGVRIAHFDVADLVTADAERRAQSAENAADGPFLIVPPLGDANGKSLAAEPCPFRADAAPLAVEAWTGAPFTADRGALAALVKLALERTSGAGTISSSDSSRRSR